MNDDVNALLREMRDIQREHLVASRAFMAQALERDAEVLEETHRVWKRLRWQQPVALTLALLGLAVLAVIAFALAAFVIHEWDY